MEIPIENIYYLLCYAWDKLAEKEVVAVETTAETNLVNLFARVLVNGTNHLLKRGFDRGYVTHQEWTGRIRGRICFEESIRRNAMATARLHCEFDDLSYNVIHNRILKSTMRLLITMEGLDRGLGEMLVSLYRRMPEVEDIELMNRHFASVQLHRNNQFYDFLLKVCQLIYDNLLPTETQGSNKFRDFVRDKQQMAVVFENFVRNFYRTHTNYLVKRENINWRWIAVDNVAADLLPKMQTDISLTSDKRKIIIDCKFTPEATQKHYEAETLRSNHLYQISAYMENLQGKLADSCEMMLLYPTMANPIHADYTHKGRKIQIRTINLNQHWQGIHNDLMNLVGSY